MALSSLLFMTMLTDDVAVDWVSNKLYWTDDGLDRIGVFDLIFGFRTSLINTGQNTKPRALVVDPINRFVTLLLYWYSIKLVHT